jgi:hypothetical protein
MQMCTADLWNFKKGIMYGSEYLQLEEYIGLEYRVS